MSVRNSVLIITGKSGYDVDRLEDIRARLKAGRMNTLVRRFDGKTIAGLPKQAPAMILLDFPQTPPANLKSLTQRLKAVYSKSTIPLSFAACLPVDAIGGLGDVFETIILHPAHPSQIATRILSLSRLQTMETEMTLRIETLSDHFGAAPPQLSDIARRKLRILFVGPANPEFMTVLNALQDSQAEIVAAFTGFTAFDYLHDQDFDAVVLNAMTSEEPAFTICATMRRNTKLFHTPTLILTGKDYKISAEQAYRKGASDVIKAGAPLEEVRGRILEQAGFHSVHEDLKSRFSGLGGSESMDAATGLYNKTFFEAHIARHTEQSRTVPVATFRITPPAGETLPAERLSRAAGQAGSMLRNLVRVQDCAARLSDDSFAVLFPCVSLEDANFAAARINAIITGTGFQDEAGNYRIDAQVEVTNAAAPKFTDEAATA